MKEFLKSLSIEQLEILKDSIDNELGIKKSLSREHTSKLYEGLTKNELNMARRNYENSQYGAKNNREFDLCQLHLDCINEKLTEIKNKNQN